MNSTKLVLHQDPNPSFSSTLLDEIYRSIDECGAGQESSGRRQSHGCGGTRSILIDQQHPINLRRVHSIGRRAATTVRDGRYGALDPSLFSGGSSSCWETENTSSLANPTPPPPRLRPVRTSAVSEAHHPASTKAAAGKKITNSWKSQKRQEESKSSGTKDGGGDRFVKSQSRALKIYNNLVPQKAKLQQPLSPGGRLSAFFNSLFAARGAGKKTNRPSSSSDSSRDYDANSSSNCSSASSYARSCLIKTSPSSRQQLNGKKSVTFHPGNLMVTTDSVAMKARECTLKNYYYHQNQSKSEFMDKVNEDDDEDDAESCTSSDLFELDHLDSINVFVR